MPIHERTSLQAAGFTLPVLLTPAAFIWISLYLSQIPGVMGITVITFSLLHQKVGPNIPEGFGNKKQKKKNKKNSYTYFW